MWTSIAEQAAFGLCCFLLGSHSAKHDLGFCTRLVLGKITCVHMITVGVCLCPNSKHNFNLKFKGSRAKAGKEARVRLSITGWRPETHQPKTGKKLADISQFPTSTQ